MEAEIVTYLSSLAQRCRLAADKCVNARAKEEISAIGVELVEYAEHLKCSRLRPRQAGATGEDAMLKIFTGAVILALATLPAAAIAQTTSGQHNGKLALPKENSAAGVKGMRGNKSGPAPKAPSTTGQNVGNSGAVRGAADNAAKGSGQTR